MKNIIVDAGPLIALFDRTDRYHKKVLDFMQSYEGMLVTTWPVITETLHILDFNVNVQIDFMKWLNQGGIKIFDLKPYHLDRLIELTEKYSDVPIDLADGTLILLSEELELDEILTIDSDFYVYRNIRRKYLKNILL